MTPDEKWLPVVGYEGRYEVSDQGRVRSVDRRVLCCHGSTRRHEGRVLKPKVDKKGYLRVALYGDSERRSQRTRLLHQLVAEAFIGPRPEGLEVCHNNGRQGDNRPPNLRYDTHQENQIDTVRLGNHPFARRTHCKHGHEYTPENTGRLSDGGRRCMTCDRIRNSERRKKRAAA